MEIEGEGEGEGEGEAEAKAEGLPETASAAEPAWFSMPSLPSWKKVTHTSFSDLVHAAHAAHRFASCSLSSVRI